MSELEGQMPLFTVDGCDAKTQAQYADEICSNPICDECGTACTSSKECVELSGLYDEDDQ